MSTIKKAKRIEGGWKLTTWEVEYNEFSGKYYLHDAEYQLQKYVGKILQERTILPKEIEKLLDLHSEVVRHNRDMEECD